MYACYRYHVIDDSELTEEQRSLFPLPVLCPKNCSRLSFPIISDPNLLHPVITTPEEKTKWEKAVIAAISHPKWRFVINEKVEF